VSRSRSLRGAVAGQAEELRAARDRIVADLERVLEILTRAGRGVRSVATGAYEDAVGPETQAPVRRRRKAAKRAVRKAGPKRAVRKEARGR
jgi:hypothetical protein